MANSTAAVLAQYSPSHFDALPSLRRAVHNLASCGGIEAVEDALKETVARHDDGKAVGWGLMLLHRHFRLGEDEVMLALGGSTVPVSRAALAAGVAHLDGMTVVPTCWSLRSRRDLDGQDDGVVEEEEEFAPLEFALVKHDATKAEEVPTLDADLARDIATLLRAHSLDRVLGLALLPADGQAGIEQTFGRANVVRPAKMFRSLPKSVEVLWSLPSSSSSSPATLQRGCRQRCLQRCSIEDEVFHYEDHEDDHLNAYWES